MSIFKNKQDQVRSGWKIILSFLLLNVLAGILIFPVILIGSGLEGSLQGNGFSFQVNTSKLMQNPNIKIGMMFAQLLGTVITIFIFLKAENKRWRDIGFTSFHAQGKNLVFGLLLGACSILFITAILFLTGQIQMAAVSITPALWQEIGLGFLTYLFVALNEELYFRGYVVSALSQTKSRKIIYLVSGLIFCAAHLSNPNVHVLGILNIFLIGFLFAYMLIRTGSLWMPAGYHLTWNFIQGNMIGFPVSGLPPEGLYTIKMADDIWTGGSFGVEASIWTTVMIAGGFFLTKFYTRSKINEAVMFADMN